MATSIQQGAFLLAVPASLAKAPARFEFGLWNGQNYSARIPAAGSTLVWNGRTPAPSVDEVVPRTALTALADKCALLPSGNVATFMQPGPSAAGSGVDPRTKKRSREIFLAFPSASSGPASSGPFSVTAVVLPSGARAPATGSVIDRAGTRQYWFTWDGRVGTKGVRDWDGARWTERTGEQADELTLRFRRQGAKGPMVQIEFFDAKMKTGDRYGIVVARGGACAMSLLEKSLTPTGRVVS